MKNSYYIRPAAALLALVLIIVAGPVAAEGDAEQGSKLGFTCRGCHGIEGYRNAYPSYRVPRLGGQKTGYLKTALTEYREGKRPHPTMHAQASSLSDTDIDDLLAWIGTFGKAADTATAAQVATVETARICVTCHGAQGASVQPAPPILAGQHRDYLVHELKQYRDGSRSGSVMSAFASTLSDADMALIAGFYASQDGVRTIK